MHHNQDKEYDCIAPMTIIRMKKNLHPRIDEEYVLNDRLQSLFKQRFDKQKHKNVML